MMPPRCSGAAGGPAWAPRGLYSPLPPRPPRPPRPAPAPLLLPPLRPPAPPRPPRPAPSANIASICPAVACAWKVAEAPLPLPPPRPPPCCRCLRALPAAPGAGPPCSGSSALRFALSFHWYAASFSSSLNSGSSSSPPSSSWSAARWEYTSSGRMNSASRGTLKTRLPAFMPGGGGPLPAYLRAYSGIMTGPNTSSTRPSAARSSSTSTDPSLSARECAGPCTTTMPSSTERMVPAGCSTSSGPTSTSRGCSSGRPSASLIDAAPRAPSPLSSSSSASSYALVMRSRISSMSTDSTSLSSLLLLLLLLQAVCPFQQQRWWQQERSSWMCGPLTLGVLRARGTV
mmetsp:Transcript_27923/g.61291  ORF Transcript_27923/g.61291 Transcript_27923/m.61291 type:complete len:344 (+) Transcript_27923:177-1208(+)